MTQISTMPVLGSLPASGYFVPVVQGGVAVNYSFDLGAWQAALAASGGSALVGIPGGGSVQDATFVKGPSAPVAGTTAQVNWQRDDALAPVASLGGLWTAATIFGHAIRKVFTSAMGGANGAVAAFVASAKNTGSPASSIGELVISEAAANGAASFGSNIIAFSSGGATGVKLVGCEIDLQPQAGAATSGGGLYLNAFTMTFPGPAIYFEGISGGKWSTGINVGNLSDTGSGISPASGNPRMGTLLDSGTAQYQIATIKLNNLHKILFYDSTNTLVNAAARYCDASNALRDVLPSGGLLWRNTADSATFGSVGSNGLLLISGGLGYQTGAGGAVTQATSRTTGVTLNKSCGQITLVSAAGSATWQTFTVTNSAIAATDVIHLSQTSGTDKYMLHVTGVRAGAFDISFATTGGTTTEQPVINFAVVKAVAA